MLCVVEPQLLPQELPEARGLAGGPVAASVRDKRVALHPLGALPVSLPSPGCARLATSQDSSVSRVMPCGAGQSCPLPCQRPPLHHPVQPPACVLVPLHPRGSTRDPDCPGQATGDLLLCFSVGKSDVYFAVRFLKGRNGATALRLPRRPWQQGAPTWVVGTQGPMPSPALPSKMH